VPTSIRGRPREIGWAPVDLTPEGQGSPLVALDGTPVLHWHGDNFDLPDGCVRLAATEGCPTQAFAKGPNILALQFHAEAVAATFEHWLIGHAVELARADCNPNTLRADARTHGPSLAIRADAMVREWLSELMPPGGRSAHPLTT
jgi:GMP synthase (glutamine-hydrolysing)